jgi:hypothetical protein
MRKSNTDFSELLIRTVFLDPSIKSVDAGLREPTKPRFAVFSNATFKSWYARKAESVGYIARCGEGVFETEEIRGFYSATGTCA